MRKLNKDEMNTIVTEVFYTYLKEKGYTEDKSNIVKHKDGTPLTDREHNKTCKVVKERVRVEMTKAEQNEGITMSHLLEMKGLVKKVEGSNGVYDIVF